jgi:hypothetical protein
MEMDEAAWTYANQRIDSQLQSFKLLQELDEWPEPSEEVRLLSRVRRD